jgi:hypothetical protein
LRWRDGWRSHRAERRGAQRRDIEIGADRLHSTVYALARTVRMNLLADAKKGED